LGAGTQAASAVPLPTYLQSFEATVNGVLAPLYFVSPTQANVQIPYGTAPGPATLVVYQGGQSAASQIQIAAAAPGIFADANGNTVPYASGSAGQTLVLFITGDGEVSPALASGSAPSTSTPVGNLPRSILPVTMTIGGQPAQIVFDGIPSGLAGATQINFVVPAGLAPGPQPVVVTVGTTPSKAATFTITSGN
jgi:adhesin/invasin